jgi:hypothetical protein
MTRDLCRWLAAAILSAVTSAALSLPRQSAEEFLSELYRVEAWRVGHSLMLPDEEQPALFAEQTGEIMREAATRPDPAVREEAAPNAFYGWGVRPGMELALTSISTVLGTRGAPTLIVDVTVAGVPRRNIVDLVEESGSWRIANVVYDEGEDFLSFERRLARR